MVDPPLLTGGVKVIVACPLPLVALPIVGAPGTVEGVATDDAAELELIPETLMAATLKVYPVPLVSPVKTKFVVPEPTLRVVAPVTPLAAVTPSEANTLTW